MSDYLSKLDNKKFHNWIKAFLAISVAKEGLETHVLSLISDWHKNILTSVTKDQPLEKKFCTLCKTDKFLTRSHQQYKYCSICDKLHDEIRQNHVSRKPSLDNTDVREMCNKIRHSPNLLVEDEDADRLLNKLIEILECSEELKSNARARKAACDIQLLKKNCLMINVKDVESVIQNTLEDVIDDFLEQLKTDPDHLKALDTDMSDTNVGVLMKKIKELAKNYKKHRKLEPELLEDLITFYREEYGNILLSPVIDETDVPILDFYVAPNMTKKEWGSIRNAPKLSVDSYEDIFGSENAMVRNVYLCGQAGTGKTTFVKHLCSVWCKSKKEKEITPVGITKEDFEVVKRFDYLFLVLLRFTQECEVDDMIMKQVVNRLSRSKQYNADFIEHVLHNYRCLIILDGLDEWCNTSLPMKNSRTKNTLLYTTRPWKMYELRLPRSKVNNYIEMSSMSELSIKTLLENIMKTINDNNEDPEKVKEFLKEIKALHLEEFLFTPFVFVHLVLLLTENRDLGRSKCQIYSNIIEYILDISQQKHKDLKCDNYFRTESANIPFCFKDNNVCQKYYSLLLTLGKISFKTLFTEKKEASVVFEESVVDAALDYPEAKECCLKLGLLTKCKDTKCTTKRKFKYSFLHKSFQDFFCALYIQSLDEFIIEDAKKVCTSLATILDMSQVFIFLGGLCPQRASEFSKMTSEMIAADAIARDFRVQVCTSIVWHERFKSLKDYQNMLVEMVHEGKENSETSADSFTLVDFFVDASFETSVYGEAFESLLEENKSNVETLTIYDSGARGTIQLYVDKFKLQCLQSLTKLEIIGRMEETIFAGLLNGSENLLQCLSVCFDRRRYKEWRKNYCLLSSESVVNVTNMSHLTALMLECFTLNHESLGFLFSFLQNRTAMQQINVAFMDCIDCGEQCQGFALNLSNHIHLCMLELGNLPISDLTLRANALKECRIGLFSVEEVFETIIKALQDVYKTQYTDSCGYEEPADTNDVKSTNSSSVEYKRKAQRLIELEAEKGEKVSALDDDTKEGGHLETLMLFDSPPKHTEKLIGKLPILKTLHTLILKKNRSLKQSN